jgi:hypothetical protein
MTRIQQAVLSDISLTGLNDKQTHTVLTKNHIPIVNGIHIHPYIHPSPHSIIDFSTHNVNHRSTISHTSNTSRLVELQLFSALKAQIISPSTSHLSKHSTDFSALAISLYGSKSPYPSTSFEVLTYTVPDTSTHGVALIC